MRSFSGAASPRAPCTRSGRTASTAPTVAAVMAASPMPISTCTPTMAVSTLPSGTSVVPPRAYRRVNMTAAPGTESSAPAKAATVTERRVSGRSFSSPRNTA